MTTANPLTLIEAARMIREAMKDKTYRAYPIGGEAGAYLRDKRKRLTASSYRDYEACLDKLARNFLDLQLVDLAPPVGITRLEEFMDEQWGARAPRTYAKNLSILVNFFDWAVARDKLVGNPARALSRPKKRGVYRETFSREQELAIIGSQPRLRDRVAVAILFHTGIRKGALRHVQFKHFDHARRRLTVFTKGGKVMEVAIEDNGIWNDLERHILERQAGRDEFLIYPEKRGPVGYDSKRNEWIIDVKKEYRHKAMADPTTHRWWYACLARAGVVEPGVTRGEKMHKARHTAGQRMLDYTQGNLKAVQTFLGHESIQTTADSYVDWELDRVAEIQRAMSDRDD